MSVSRLKPLSQEVKDFAFEHLRVDASSKTGLVWRSHPDRSHQRLVGKPAGSLSRGYWQLNVAKVNVRAHRIVWLLSTGEDYANAGRTIDHINGDGHDNRVENLRLATDSEQMFNRRKYTAPNAKLSSSGYRWTYRCRTRWEGRFSYDNKTIRCGSFATPEEAHAAVLEKRKEYGV